MNILRRAWNRLLDLFDDKDDPREIIYDPVDVAGVVVGCLAALGALYWLLWALLVCGGGVLAKIGPFLQVVFTSKTLRDFGYEGYPYRLGVFEGWVVNAAALGLTLVLVAALKWFYERAGRKR